MQNKWSRWLRLVFFLPFNWLWWRHTHTQRYRTHYYLATKNTIPTYYWAIKCTYGTIETRESDANWIRFLFSRNSIIYGIRFFNRLRIDHHRKSISSWKSKKAISLLANEGHLIITLITNLAAINYQNIGKELRINKRTDGRYSILGVGSLILLGGGGCEWPLNSTVPVPSGLAVLPDSPWQQVFLLPGRIWQLRKNDLAILLAFWGRLSADPHQGGNFAL